MPSFEGTFAGTVIHTSEYKSGRQLLDQRVLIVGAGNSGCDIAVDAVHHAASVDLSVRRGYHFVPKYLFGKPADTLNQGRPLPARIKQAVDKRVLRLFTGDPVRLGFPEPDHKIYESHPIVNSLILHHLGHGDLRVRADVERFDGHTVHFRDGSADDYDLVVLATGYRLHYPFIDAEHLSWDGAAPDLYLNIFAERHPTLFVLGMLEASGIGWQGRYEQADLVARYVAARRDAPDRAAALDRAIAGPRPDLYRRLPLPGHRPDGLLRQQGRLPRTGASVDRGAHRMTDVDAITIAFDEASLTTLKIVIGAILFGIALDTRLEDFRAALARPKAMATGLVAQFLLLPPLTFVLTLVLDVRGSVALGMILVACCPPGNVSNILTHRAKGDVALSVSMTAVGNVLAIFLLPLNFAFWGGLHPTGQDFLEKVEVTPWDMLSEILLVIGIPFALGLAVGAPAPPVRGQGASDRRQGGLRRPRGDHRDRRRQELGHLHRVHRHRPAGGVPARRHRAGTGMVGRPRHATA